MWPDEGCSARVVSPGAFHDCACSRKAIVQRDGSGYCRQHDPERVNERRKKREALWNAERETNKARADLREARDNVATAALLINESIMPPGLVDPLRAVVKARVSLAKAIAHEESLR